MKIIYLELTEEHAREVIDGLDLTISEHCGSVREIEETEKVRSEIQSQIDDQTETTVKGFRHE